jgi:RNA polymerase sigma-70 factor (ECF subfamily)
MNQNDKACVERCRAGDPEEFRFLVQRYEGLLFAYLLQRLRDRSLAEEAAQESFVRAFLSLSKLRKPESFYAWLLGIGARIAKEYLRGLSHQQAEPLAELELAAEVPGANYEDQGLEEAIAELPEAYRQVILLRFYEELSCQEVAQRLGLPLGTVTKTLSRAYAMLRQILRAHNETEATACLEVTS